MTTTERKPISHPTPTIDRHNESEVRTHPKPEKRDLHGILLLDKPTGITSNGALQICKRLFRARKAGHTGSLDPIASGMLPICFGEATKFSQYLLESDKHYQVTAQLGAKTTTSDTEGEVIARAPVPELTHDDINKILLQFTGEITQIPSMFSAIKHKGQPLYKLARQGIEVERKPREVTIYSLELISLEADVLQLDVRCSKGTYVRNLVEDIGDVIGCGAHVSALRRSQVGAYPEKGMLTMEQLEALANDDASLLDTLQPLSTTVAHLPSVNLTPAMAMRMQQGENLHHANLPEEGVVRLQLTTGEFVGIGEVIDEGARVAPRRIMRNL